MDLGLKNKVIMVAAASKGLGFGVAQALANEGAKVSICSRDEANTQAAAKKLREETGADILAIACDVAEPSQLQNWVSKTVDTWGQIDGLLVNAGGPPSMKFRDIDDAAWQSAFELTLLSSVRMIRAVLPYMPANSAILTVTSTSIVEPIEGLILSTVMRSGVAGMVKSLADELAPSEIRINNLMPGRIETERVDKLDHISAERQAITFEEVRERSVSKIPLKRLGTIEEFGAAATFLLSPAAQYITGASLRVDGGAMRSI